MFCQIDGCEELAEFEVFFPGRAQQVCTAHADRARGLAELVRPILIQTTDPPTFFVSRRTAGTLALVAASQLAALLRLADADGTGEDLVIVKPLARAAGLDWSACVHRNLPKKVEP